MSEVYPASFAQRRLWFIEQLAPDGARQHIDLTRRVHGTIDVATLQRCVDTVVARHESLRTRFGMVDGTPVQVVEPTVAVPVEVIDTPDVSATMREFSDRPFRLDAAPLLRVALIRGDDESILTFVLHHIIADGWSLGILAEEIARCYRAYLGDVEPQLRPLALQYVDFTLWQAEAVGAAGDSVRHRAYVDSLSGAPQVLELPGDRPRPDTPRHEGAIVEFGIPGRTLAAVERLAAQCDSTVYMTLLSAFFLVLARWSGQRDLLVASPSAGRGHSQTEALIGFFVNTVVLRGDLSGSPTVAELVARTREACLAAFAGEDMPFERLVEDLAPNRSLSHHPLVQVMFAYQNTPGSELELPGARLEKLDVYGITSMFDMTMELAPGDDGLDGVVQYATAVFDPQTASRFARHFGNAVAAMAADADRNVATIELLDDVERESLLRKGTGAAPSKSAPVPTQAWQRSESDPERVAVVDADGTASYGALQRHAAAVASRLKRFGLPSEALVAVCLPRDRYLLSALLGVWAADAAFVPLDPGYPAARLEFMLADSGARAVLTTRQLASQLPLADQARVVYVEDLEPIAVEHRAPPIVPLDRLAYAIYTSGSTGRPKCVQIEHRGLANQIEAFTELLEFTADDRMAGMTSMSFDPALIELFVPLASGGTVVMCDSAVAGDPERLESFLADNDITVAQATPSTWQLYTDHTTRTPARLRCVLTGGEVLPAALATHLLKLGVSVHNVYGPTETTVWATSASVTDPDQISVGAPIPGLRMFIMDTHGQLAPDGAAGELWIAGAGVARSYRGRHDLTEQSFVTAPDGSRAFRTGDLARWRGDGQLAYLGRIDDQVKIRGHRIELGEIEAVLRELAEVRDALTAVRTAPDGDRHIVAAVAGAGDDLARKAKDWARQQLPTHMVPAQIVGMDSLPLTPSGKGDRKSLAQLVVPAPQAGELAVPTGELQRQLHDVWCEVLEVPAVSVNANLFEIGATSLSIVRARQVLRSRYDIDLPLTAFFTHPTIAALADRDVSPPAATDTRTATRRRVTPGAARRRQRRGKQ